MTRVKICGCMRVADAIAARDAGADFVGILFAPASQRRVPVEEAAEIVASLGVPLRDIEQDDPPPLHPGRFATPAAWYAHGAEALERLLARKRPLTVGVFENQPVEEVNEIADEAGLDLVQLSGDEPWSDCLLVARQAIKVLRPRGGETARDLVRRVEPGAAVAVMLDPSRGTGASMDPEIAAGVAVELPIWLAGGLTPESVADTIRAVRPWAVDVSSGVETHGAKDPAKIMAFVQAAKGVAV